MPNRQRKIIFSSPYQKIIIMHLNIHKLIGKELKKKFKKEEKTNLHLIQKTLKEHVQFDLLRLDEYGGLFYIYLY